VVCPQGYGRTAPTKDALPRAERGLRAAATGDHRSTRGQPGLGRPPNGREGLSLKLTFASHSEPSGSGTVVAAGGTNSR